MSLSLERERIQTHPEVMEGIVRGLGCASRPAKRGERFLDGLKDMGKQIKPHAQFVGCRFGGDEPLQIDQHLHFNVVTDGPSDAQLLE